MDAATFQAAFTAFPDPVLLKTPDGWLQNPAALSLCLSETELEQLSQLTGEVSLWLAGSFFRASVARPDGQLLVTLRADLFLSSAAGNVATQLRRHLTAVFYSTDALAKNPQLRADDRARDHLSALHHQFHQLLRMATQLDRCGSPEAISPNLDCVDLQERFLRWGSEAAELCRAAGIRLTVDAPNAPLPLVADIEQLEYLVFTLLSNAVKYAPETGGRITLSLRRQDTQAVITVTDNGAGLPPDRLLHPLWNQPNNLEVGRGLGLGLPLAQRIAAAHDGTLVVTSADPGARVVLSIPIREHQDLFARPRPSVTRNGGFSLARILLSDALPHSLYFPQSDEDAE